MAWWRRLFDWLFPKPQPSITREDIVAIVEAMDSTPKGGWYCWECAQFRETQAPWFDPHRYDGSKIAYAEPTIEEHQDNYRASMESAFAEYGHGVVSRATWWVNEQTLVHHEMRGLHMLQPDPIGWCVKRYLEAGEPTSRPPTNWVPGAPQRHAALGI